MTKMIQSPTVPCRPVHKICSLCLGVITLASLLTNIALLFNLAKSIHNTEPVADKYSWDFTETFILTDDDVLDQHTPPFRLSVNNSYTSDEITLQDVNDFNKFYRADLHRVSVVNCSAIFSGDEREIERASVAAKLIAAAEETTLGDKKNHKMMDRLRLEKKITKFYKFIDTVVDNISEFSPLTSDFYINATRNCTEFKKSRGYITSYLTQEEREFPIAFTMMVYKDVEMVERLLRVIYRPQNRYCIHVDAKAEEKFYQAVEAITACFPGSVRLASRRIDVCWGEYTVLEPELVCLKDLWGDDTRETNIDPEVKGSDPPSVSTSDRGPKNNSTSHQRWKTQWKYFINLTGQEFTLKTNYELVQILKALKGANVNEGTVKRANKDRWKTKAPHGLTPTKGGVHTVLNRATVDFILHSPVARDIIEWVKKQHIPDEAFYATINFNPHMGITGIYNGTKMEKQVKLTRYKMWHGINCSSHEVVRDICILSTGDLPQLGRTPNLFANKFYLHQDRIVIGCLEERNFNNTRDEFLGLKTFNTTFYENQDFVKNRVIGRSW